MKNLNLISDPDIKNILKMPCEFKDYEVVYDTEDILNYSLVRARKYNVKLTPTKTGVNQTEICSGTVKDCLMYLKPYIESDYGYAAGQTFNIVNAPNTSEFKAAFQKFIKWLSTSKRFSEFEDGVKIGDMKNFMI